MGRANEPLRQLVGDVVVLRQQLARKIEGDRFGAMRNSHRLQSPCDLVEGVGPTALCAVDDRMQQPRLEPERLAERGAFGTEPAGVGWVIGISLDACATLSVRCRQHPATDAAVGTGGSDRLYR